MRTATGIRLALGLAVLLSIGGSLGLHPEPSDPGKLPPAGSVIAKPGNTTAPHRCLACLTYGTALPSALALILLAGDPLIPTGCTVNPIPVGRSAGRPLSGRSPPSRS
ncbi:MAG TPA: hypothetical protein VGL03_00990 [Thermoanaerobaculia bacterium]